MFLLLFVVLGLFLWGFPLFHYLHASWLSMVSKPRGPETDGMLTQPNGGNPELTGGGTSGMCGPAKCDSRRDYDPYITTRTG